MVRHTLECRVDECPECLAARETAAGGSQMIDDEAARVLADVDHANAVLPAAQAVIRAVAKMRRTGAVGGASLIDVESTLVALASAVKEELPRPRRVLDRARVGA